MSALRKILATAALALAVLAPSAQADWRSAPVVPRLDHASASRIDARLDGAGVRRNVFAKVGDSISYDETFLQGFGCGPSDLGRYGGLSTTIRYFRRASVPRGRTPELCERTNSFSRRSPATVPGKTAYWALSSGALRRELSALRPAYALVMFGTNDAEVPFSVEEYRRAVEGIVTASLRRGTTPILYTLPSRQDDQTVNPLLDAYSDTVLSVGRERKVPVINLRRALAAPGVINSGITADGWHLSVLGSEGGTAWEEAHRATTLTPEGLRYGANIRNLLTLQTLAKLRKECGT